jgi:hypothetical protein
MSCKNLIHNILEGRQGRFAKETQTLDSRRHPNHVEKQRGNIFKNWEIAHTMREWFF